MPQGSVQRFLGSSVAAKGDPNFLRESGIPPYFLSLLRGLRNGLYYGVKVRLPHALVCICRFVKCWHRFGPQQHA